MNAHWSHDPQWAAILLLLTSVQHFTSRIFPTEAPLVCQLPATGELRVSKQGTLTKSDFPWWITDGVMDRTERTQVRQATFLISMNILLLDSAAFIGPTIKQIAVSSAPNLPLLHEVLTDLLRMDPNRVTVYLGRGVGIEPSKKPLTDKYVRGASVGEPSLLGVMENFDAAIAAYLTELEEGVSLQQRVYGAMRSSGLSPIELLCPPGCQPNMSGFVNLDELREFIPRIFMITPADEFNHLKILSKAHTE